MNKDDRARSTKAVHEGRGYGGDTGAVMPPVFLTSTFETGNPEGFDYTRSGNPNFRLLERAMASLEGAEYATCFASGVSAITAVVSTLKSGDLVVGEENVYGCTYRLFDKVFAKFGVDVLWVDLSDPANWSAIRDRRPAMVWVESPTNPLLKIIDIEGISAVAAKAGSPVVVDNTFASPCVQRPLAFGATMSLSSTTKYINGHSDCLGGVVATDDPGWQEQLLFAQKALGLQPSPFDAWLTTRGVRTLDLRMRQHGATGLALAQWLEDQPFVARVIYPFLSSHPRHDLACRQMSNGSGLITIELPCDQGAALSFCRRLRLFTLAESLGGVESLICHPASMTHASIPSNVRQDLGIGDGLLRLSVGIEDVDDLKADLDEALRAEVGV